MKKWHINKKGEPAICKASKKACPLGTHYNTEEEAFDAVSHQFESEFGILPETGLSLQKKKDLGELIQRISGVKSSGFDYECFASVSVADKLGLDKIAITDKNGLTINLSMDSEKDTIDGKVPVERSIEGLVNYYRKIGVPIKDINKLTRVVYYSEDKEKGVLVQSGGSNVLDAAIIKADNVVDIIEVKRLDTGAQLPTNKLEVDKYGNIKPESIAEQEEYIKQALEGIKIQDADGTNVKLDFGDDKANQRLPLHYFVTEYKRKGATSFIYTTNHGNTIHEVDLTGDTDEVVDRLLEKNIKAKVNLRANLNKGKAYEDDIYRFNNILSKKYFKSGRASHTESFTLKSIKEEEIKKSGDYVRVGGYILPIKHKDYHKHINKRIKKSDMRAFRLSLTGEIKTNY